MVWGLDGEWSDWIANAGKGVDGSVNAGGRFENVYGTNGQRGSHFTIATPPPPARARFPCWRTGKALEFAGERDCLGAREQKGCCDTVLGRPAVEQGDDGRAHEEHQEVGLESTPPHRLLRGVAPDIVGTAVLTHCQSVHRGVIW
jgi:hypothetical protein